MSKRYKIYLVLIGITLLVIVYAELSKPKQVNWFASYTSHHKIPFGAFIFKNLIDSKFDSIVSVDRPPYEFLDSNTIEGTYLFFNDGLEFGEAELNSLLEWTSKGNTLMLASSDFNYNLLDTLGIDTDMVRIPGNFTNEYELELSHPELKTEKQTVFDRATTLYHFSKIDTTYTTIIGILDKYQDSQTKQIRF